MSSSKQKAGAISEAEKAKIQSWRLPEVFDDTPKSNKEQVAFNPVDFNATDDEDEQEKLHLPTAEELEQIQKQAYDEGYSKGFAEGKAAGFPQGVEDGRQSGHKEGFDKGHSEAFEQGQKETQQKVAYLDQLMSMLNRPFSELDKEVEEQLVSLAMAVAKHLVRREIKTDPGQVVAAVREAVSALPASNRRVHLYLHPEDAALVRSAMSVSEDEVSWKIVEDPILSRGGCRVLTDTSQIDATVESRLAAIIARAMGGERGGDD